MRENEYNEKLGQSMVEKNKLGENGNDMSELDPMVLEEDFLQWREKPYFLSYFLLQSDTKQHEYIIRFAYNQMDTNRKT